MSSIFLTKICKIAQYLYAPALFIYHHVIRPKHFITWYILYICMHFFLLCEDRTAEIILIIIPQSTAILNVYKTIDSLFTSLFPRKIIPKFNFLKI